MKKGLITALALVGSLTGCSTLHDWFYSRSGKEVPPSPLPKVSDQGAQPFIPLWTGSAGNGTGKQFLHLAPLVLEGRLLVASADGRVAAYEIATGKLAWETQTEIPISGGTGGGDGLVVVAGTKGEVVTLDLTNGRELWRTTLSSEVLSPPKVADGVVVIRSIDGRVAGLAANNGNRLWVFNRNMPTLSLRGTSAPILAPGRVFIGLDSGRLIALGLRDGRLLWETPVAQPKGRSELERLADIDADPVLMGTTLYVVSYQGRVMAIDGENGQVRWSKDMSSVAGLGVDRDMVFVSDDEGIIWGLERRTGAALWRQDAFKGRSPTAPTPYGNAIVLGDFEGYLHAVSREDGRIVAQTRIDSSPLYVPPLLHAAVLYAVSSGGTVAALRD